MQKNLFFMCGPHGCGKTTLADLLAKEDPALIVPDLYSRNIKFDTDPKDRLLLKICERGIENFEYLQTAIKNPEKIVIGNRCIYDQQIYGWIYSKLGWIDEDEFCLSNTLASNFYIRSLRHPYAVVLNPPFNIVKKHLEKRWLVKGKKWREDDLEYSMLACEAYKRFKSNDKVFYIDHEFPLGDKTELKQLIDWMHSKKEHSLDDYVVDVGKLQEAVNL